MAKIEKFTLDLDHEEFIITFTDRQGKKRRFKVITSEGLIEYRDSRGRKYLRLMLEGRHLKVIQRNLQISTSNM